MKTSEQGEIATILTLGVLVVIGVSAMVSSLFLNQKKTTGSQAAVTCDDPKWACGPECASQEVRNVYADNSDKWRAEAGKIYGGCDKENQPIPPTPSCPGKYDNNGSCNPACCNSDSQCSDGQKCNIPNGFCKSTTSCNPNKEAKFHETCVGGACVKQACPDTGTCVDDCSSCSGESTGSTGTTAGDPTRCTGADNTSYPVGTIKGDYLCCAANDNPENEKWGWATWNKDGKCKTAGGTSNTPASTTRNCVDYGDVTECKGQCHLDKPGWSCKGTQCCLGGIINPTKPVPSPTPMCKAFSSPDECEMKCGDRYGSEWSCVNDSSLCCLGGKDPRKFPTQTPTIVVSPPTPGTTAQPTPTLTPLSPSGCKWDSSAGLTNHCVENYSGSCAGSCAGDTSARCTCVRPSPIPSSTPTPSPIPTRPPSPIPSPRPTFIGIRNLCTWPSGAGRGITLEEISGSSADPITINKRIENNEQYIVDITRGGKYGCSDWALLYIKDKTLPIILSPIICDATIVFEILGHFCPP